MMLLEGNISLGKPTVIFNVYFFSMRESDLTFINDVDTPLKVQYILLLYFFQLVTVSSRKSSVFFKCICFFQLGKDDLTYK